MRYLIFAMLLSGGLGLLLFQLGMVAGLNAPYIIYLTCSFFMGWAASDRHRKSLKK